MSIDDNNTSFKAQAKIVHTNEPGHEKMCLMSYANIKDADQPAHPHSLISAFVFHCLDSVISIYHGTVYSGFLIKSATCRLVFSATILYREVTVWLWIIVSDSHMFVDLFRIMTTSFGEDSAGLYILLVYLFTLYALLSVLPAPVAQVVECPLRGTGGCGFDPQPRHIKVVKTGTSCSSLGTQNYGVALGLVDSGSG